MSLSSRIQRHSQTWIASLRQIAIGFLIVFGAKAAIADTFYIPSGSMEPTLLIGDGLVASKFPYGYSTASIPFVTLSPSKRIFAALPKRGDVVVFRWPGDRSQTWVKRVIGLPGDRISLHDGQVWINGRAADLRPDGVGQSQSVGASPLTARRYIETLPGPREHVIFKLPGYDPLDNVAEVVVPPEHLFVMGDNRDNSADSRVPVAAGGVGMLPVANLVGRVEVVVGSWDFASGPRWSRFFNRVN